MSRLTVVSAQVTTSVPSVPHFFCGSLQEGSGSEAFSHVHDPCTGDIIGRVFEASDHEIEKSLAMANKAFIEWSSLSIKQRSTVLFAFRQLLVANQTWFVQTIRKEHGKHETDALASFLKGVETLDYALSLPALAGGRTMEVSSGVTCQDRKDPVGIVLSIVPFNFPVMVPMWTLPIALMLGNGVVMKPSEKVPSCLVKMGMLLKEAGLPDGVYTVLHGGKNTVQKLVTHKLIHAVTFVGSTPIAKLVYDLANVHNKRGLCLGGAKNHLVAYPDCDVQMTANDVVASFTGSSGQRCMAASVLLVLDSQPLEQNQLVRLIVSKARELQPGQQGPSRMGPVIDDVALKRITKFVEDAERKHGAKILLDGRAWKKERGYWFGPTVIVHPEHSNDPAITDEIFGPVLSVLRVKSLEEAISRINEHPYGNAACIYTTNGGVADTFTKAVNVGMIGVNIGVPVPREPFSFGGSKQSKFGISDITGDGLVEFLTRRVKITSKWTVKKTTDLVAEAFVK